MSKQNSRWSTKESILNTLIFLILLLQCIGNALSMELYFMDHEVTEKKAQIAVREAFNRTQKQGKPNWCGECTDELRDYCFSRNLIQDHCCCDQAHGKEKMPWIPHSCYTGEDVCRPVAGSCVEYMHRRQCCCDKLLVEFWHNEYSAAISTRPYVAFILLPIVMLTAAVHKAFYC